MEWKKDVKELELHSVPFDKFSDTLNRLDIYDNWVETEVLIPYIIKHFEHLGV